MKLSSHDTSNQFDPTSSVAEHPGPGAVADGLALHVQTMQLAAHVQGLLLTYRGRAALTYRAAVAARIRGGGKIQGAAALTSHLN